MLRFGGTLVCVGMPVNDPVPIATAFPTKIIAKQFKIVGSAVGNRREASEALEMAARGIVKFPVRVVGMSDLQSVFEEMGEGKLIGRAVLDFSK
jgi:alcohol dehydrogenase, propanol-preferring